jgi:hypothetical protein
MPSMTPVAVKFPRDSRCFWPVLMVIKGGNIDSLRKAKDTFCPSSTNSIGKVELEAAGAPHSYIGTGTAVAGTLRGTPILRTTIPPALRPLESEVCPTSGNHR